MNMDHQAHERCCKEKTTTKIRAAGGCARVLDADRTCKGPNDKLDDMSEMTEMERLRLQMAMGQVSITEIILSNILRKASHTAASIWRNLVGL